MANMERMERPDRDPPTPRVRSRVACQTCNRRKVRCNVAQTGPPCTNCRHQDQVCTVVPRKKHKPRRPRASQVSQPAVVDTSQVSIADDDDDHEDTARTMTPEADGRLPDDDATTYIGDNRGPRQSVYELCHPQMPQEARTAAPQPAGRSGTATAPSWSPHETAYLRHEGAFQTLPPDVCDDILRAYFAHVHFFIPILDVADIVRAYTQHGRMQGLHPLLCWSMCLAAANFLPADVLTKTGFRSRKAMKEAMYARAKCLYDLDRSTDKVTLIQAVLLMGFWYTDAYDHTGAWHWVGIAISLAQSLGFHRKPHLSSARRHPDGDARRTSLVRRIWWTCLVRDRWVALAKGRPMRIHDEDCDVPLPVREDLEADFVEGLQLEEELGGFHHLLPSRSQASALARMWLRMVTISALLGRIVRAHYRVQGPPPRREDIDNYERELQICASEDTSTDDGSDGTDNLPDDHLLLHQYHVDLFYNATVAILYRPYLLHAPASLPAGASDAWQTRAARRARAAASRTNDILHRLIELDAIHLLKQMTITALVPAMQIHLYDFCKATNPLLRSLGKNKLGLCLLVLSHVRNTYWSASVIHRLFTRAQQILQDASGKGSAEKTREVQMTEDAQPTAPGPTTNHDSISSLNNYASDIPTPTPTLTPTPTAQAFTMQPYLPNPPPPPSFAPSLPPPQPQAVQQPDTSWWDEPATFLNVDLLLSPGFALSDDVCQTLFQNYGAPETNAAAATNSGPEMEMMYM
ncbi:hypothetical protein SEUCBS139899_002591 [Sporothrix eucalyptigena]